MAIRKKKKPAKRAKAKRGSARAKPTRKKSASAKRSASKKTSPKKKSSAKKTARKKTAPKKTAKKVTKKVAKKAPKKKPTSANSGPTSPAKAVHSTEPEERTKPFHREMEEEPERRRREPAEPVELGEEIEDELGNGMALEDDEETDADFLDKPEEISSDEDTE